MDWPIFAVIGVVAGLGLLAGLRALVWRTLAQAARELTVSGVRVLIPPGPAKFTGASWLRRPRGDGVIALTQEELLFWPLFGPPLRVPRWGIQGAWLSRWFRGYMRVGRKHLVLELSGGRRIAFFVADPGGWMKILKEGG